MSRPGSAVVPPRRRRDLVVVVVLALVALAGAWAWRHHARADATAGAYRTARVDRGDIRVVISSTGQLSAISTVVVGSEVSGKVTDIYVDFNDRVHKGQVLARIDPSTYQAQIAQGSASINAAQANAVEAEAALRNAEVDYRRKAELGRSKLVAQSDVDLALSTLQRARATLNANRAQIAQQQAGTRTARLNLGRTEIRSPVDGVVLTRTIEAGQTVAASFQAPELFKLAEDLSKMKIELAVDEADIGQVSTGQPATFTVDAYPDRRFRGRVSQVRLSATTTNNVVTYPVVIEVDNRDGKLLPGMTANAEIEVSSRSDVVRVPNAALRYKPSDDELAAMQSGEGAGGGRMGMTEDLQKLATLLSPTPPQRAAFDAAVEQMRERMKARAAQAQQQGGGSRLFGGGPGGGRGGPGGGAQGGGDNGAMRQRIAERMTQQFAAFRATLTPEQQQRWDRGLDEMLAARRAPVYLLVDGKPRMRTVRLGASDGSFTEVTGLQPGDVVITGQERKAP